MVKSSTSSLGASVSPGAASPTAHKLEPGFRLSRAGAYSTTVPASMELTIEYQGHEGSTVQ